jgi:hypothetical protein
MDMATALDLILRAKRSFLRNAKGIWRDPALASPDPLGNAKKRCLQAAQRPKKL